MSSRTLRSFVGKTFREEGLQISKDAVDFLLEKAEHDEGGDLEEVSTRERFFPLSGREP